MIGGSAIGQVAIGDLKNKLLTGTLITTVSLFNQSGIVLSNNDDVSGAIVQNNSQFASSGTLSVTYDSISLSGTSSSINFTQSGSLDVTVSNLTSFSTSSPPKFNSIGNLGLSAETITFTGAVSRLSNFTQHSTLSVIAETIEISVNTSLPLFNSSGGVTLSNKTVTVEPGETIKSSLIPFNQKGDLYASFSPDGYIRSTGSPFLSSMRAYVTNPSCTINPFTVACNGLLQEGDLYNCSTSVEITQNFNSDVTFNLDMNIEDTGIEELVDELDADINNTLETDLCQH